VSIGLRDERVLIYNPLPTDATTDDGFTSARYAVEASDDDDGAWWAAVVQLDAFSLSSALQQDTGTRFKLNMHAEAPVGNDSIMRRLTTGELVKVDAVNELRSVDTTIVAATWRENARFTLDDDVDDYTVASVDVEPDPVTLSVGTSDPEQFTATPRNAAGIALNGFTPAWTSSDRDVLLMSGGGIGTARAPGTVTVTATAGGVSGTADVTVTA
jgi:hypothetical protein